MPAASASSGFSLGNMSGGAMDFGGIAAGFLGNAAAASTSWDRQKNLMTRGMIYQKKGLMDAGYNPLLALTGGGLGPSSARAPQSSSSGRTNPASTLLGDQRDLLREQTAAASAMGGKNTEEARWAKMRNDYYTMNPNALRDFVTNESTPNDASAMILKMIKGYLGDENAAPSSAAGDWFKKVQQKRRDKHAPVKSNWWDRLRPGNTKYKRK